MKAININDSEYPYTEKILECLKTIETRDKNTLKSLVGTRVGIIKTGCGKALLTGFVDIIGVKKYNTVNEFRSDVSKHLVNKGNKYDIKNGKVKYGYILSNPKRCTPVQIKEKGIVIRNIHNVEE